MHSSRTHTLPARSTRGPANIRQSALWASRRVSDSGQEVYNFCNRDAIDKIVLMGVHTNICILNRGFGTRQMTRLGFDVARARDLTDARYDPRTRPFVSHARGTELVVEHIEAMWAPSILSDDLTHVVPGTADVPALPEKRQSGG